MIPIALRPVIPGFHPDPSVCRVGDDFYLVNSTFEYLPAVPLHHSRDLRAWEQIANVLDRPEQLPRASTGRGIFAPTLRHDGERFWMVTTDMDRRGEGQLIVHADDPRGPWSAPRFVAGAIGIDPDLAWDEDGRCQLTWASFENGPRIVQAEIDARSGVLRDEPRTIWRGSGLANTEGPHLYRRGEWWYLLVAEGGTERGHAISVARSRSIRGPFEGHPANPVYSHRSLAHPVQNTGHADLVERGDGSWAMVFLAVRPRGVTPGFHVNGRETFAAHVEWSDGWPVVGDALEGTETGLGFFDGFTAPSLDRRWISPGVWPDSFATVDPGHGLRLRGRATAQNALLRRVDLEEWTATLTLEAGDAALLLRLDDDHYVRVSADAGAVHAQASIVGGPRTLGSLRRPEGPVSLTIVAEGAAAAAFAAGGPDLLRLGITRPDGFAEIAAVDGRYVSTEVAGGFTGRTIGAQLTGDSAVISSIRLA